MNIEAIKTEMQDAAAKAAQDYLDRGFAGEDQGACGFAWLNIYPEHKGNTRLGKDERNLIHKLGAEQDICDRKRYQIWNPSKNNCQNIDAKEAGAEAAAEVLKKYGFKVSTGSRLD